MGLVIATLAVLVAPGCKRATRSSPTKVLDAHVAALEADDPAAAYALLSDEVKAQTPYEEYAARWRRDAKERTDTAKAAQGRTADEEGALYGGTTVHSGGQVLRWTEIAGEYYVASGLPGRSRAETPAEAVRAFIVAVRTTDFGRVRALLSDELADGLDDDWEARVEAIERALEEPGALQLSDDLRRAALRYESDRAIRLEQSPDGWKITALE